MLKTFKVTNFCSIGETQELSFLINKKDILDESARQLSNELVINLVACVIGHNASGKTNILKALTFALIFMRKSYYAKSVAIPFETHALKPKVPSRFELEFINDDALFQYWVEMKDGLITKEFLGKKKIRGFSRIFEYARTKDSWDFKSAEELHINPSDLNRFKERKHVSVLSSLIALDYLKDFRFFDYRYSNVDRFGLMPKDSYLTQLLETSESLAKDKALRGKALDFLKDVDMGIDELGFREVSVAQKDDLETKEKVINLLLQGMHKTTTGNFSLDFIEESNGTQLTTLLISELFPILENGGIAILDEIEAGLHPYVVKKIITLFESKKLNPNNAQLIFSTHQHPLLNDRTKSQIFITEKSIGSAETVVFRLDEIEGIRNDENYFNKYITGTYGGTPRIDFF
jgi:AAA15 family ATPase/GTPase